MDAARLLVYARCVEYMYVADQAEYHLLMTFLNDCLVWDYMTVAAPMTWLFVDPRDAGLWQMEECDGVDYHPRAV